MNHYRLLILVLGPVPIVAGSIGLTRWLRSDAPATVAGNQVVVRGQHELGAAAAQRPWPQIQVSSDQSQPAPRDADKLDAACRRCAAQLETQLGDGCRVIVRVPFVIAGDFNEAELEQYYGRTIGSAARAMAHSYFSTPPSQPITVLLFSTEHSYNRYAQKLYGDEGISVYGYYKPHLRTLVMNISTGGGTLVHELTHALIDFDFPEVPAWFNEGLASLHEQCHIRPDETGIDGLVNWRLAGLREALAAGRLRPLASLIGDDDFRGPQETINYAQARYFCLYMQEQGVLEQFYRRFRETQPQDPQGLKAVMHVFPNRTWETLDADFRRWAAALEQ